MVLVDQALNYRSKEQLKNDLRRRVGSLLRVLDVPDQLRIKLLLYSND